MKPGKLIPHIENEFIGDPMKKILCLGLVSLFSVASLAANSPDSACRVTYRGETVTYTAGDEFFQAAHTIAQREKVCVHAKIHCDDYSGRVYSSRDNGRLLGVGGKKKDLSNTEAEIAAAGQSCIQLSCREIGIDRCNKKQSKQSNDVPVIIVPSMPNTGTGGY